MLTLTTSPQVIGKNESGTIHTYLYGWYSNQVGDNCTVHTRLTVINTGVTYTGTNKTYFINLGEYSSGVQNWSYTPLNTSQEYTVAETTWTYSGGAQISASAGFWSYSYGNADILSLLDTVYVPVFSSAPSGLNISNVVPHPYGFSATVLITDWGGAGDATTRYREFQVWTYDASSLVLPQKYARVYGNSLSSTITVDNGSTNGALTIVPNTRYTLGMLASNGTYDTGSQRFGTFYTTLALPPIIKFQSANQNNATFTYDIPADGGFYNKTVQYSLDNGTTWETITTVSGGSSTSGTFTINNLDPSITYIMKLKTTTTAGDSYGEYYFTLGNIAVYGPDPNNLAAKRAGILYGSVNGRSRLISKMYGSVNGESRLIYQGFGRLQYPM